MSSSVYTLLFIGWCVYVRANYSNFGSFRAILYSDWITCDHNKNLDLNVSLTHVSFYDFKNNFNITTTIYRAADLITTSYNLDITRKLIVFVPGYKSHISRKTGEFIRQTVQNVSNIYLIILNHSEYTSARGEILKSYSTSVLHSYYLGKAIGEFLGQLNTKGYPSKNIHCVGYSLGCHMLGYAGETYTNVTTEKLWRITAIEPAGPCFSNSSFLDQIRSVVAEYVEVYHCNSGVLGTTSVLADTDFFFNEEGAKQPNCSEAILGEILAAICSHRACLKYWAMTMHNSEYFLARKCHSYNEFNLGKCVGNEVTIAGYSNPGNATGVFYVSTEDYGV